jgi:hypothetical protein
MQDLLWRRLGGAICSRLGQAAGEHSEQMLSEVHTKAFHAWVGKQRFWLQLLRAWMDGNGSVIVAVRWNSVQLCTTVCSCADFV